MIECTLSRIKPHPSSNTRLSAQLISKRNGNIYPWDKRPLREHWINKDLHKCLLDWLGDQLGYKSMDDWYNLSSKDIIRYGGQWMLQYYNNSPSKVLQSIYSDHRW